MAVENFDQVTIEPAKLRPFSRFIMSIGELPTSYLDSLSYAEQVTWFCDYLQNHVIPAVNTNAAALAEVQNLMTELQEYVDHYFDNLDIQAEINQKLDQMAEDGSLTNLIKNYVDPLINNQNIEINNIRNMVSSVASGSPLVATSTSEMTETDRVYVNTTDGKWYYYDGDSWKIGGTYQATGIAKKSISPDETIMWNSTNLVPKNNWKTGKVYNVSNGNEQTYTGCLNEEYVPINTDYITPIPYRSSTLRGYFYDEDYTYISGTQLNSLKVTVPENAKFIRFAYWSVEFTQVPDNQTQVYTIEDINNVNLPYDIKNMYYNKNLFLNNSALYDKLFKFTGDLYGESLYFSNIQTNNNKVSYSVNNNSGALKYGGVYIQANLKAGDIIRIKGNNLTSAIYTGPTSAANISFTKYTDYQEAVITQNFINSNSGLNIYRITQGYEINYNDTVELEVFINGYPKQLNELIKTNQSLKVISLGDSITALTGNRSWLTYFNEIQPIDIIQNVAVNGAWLMDKEGTEYDGNPVFNGPDNNVNNVLGNQVQKILNNNYADPDIILIAIGINGGITCTENDIYNSYYDSTGNLIPLSNVDRKTSAGAFRYCNTKLREKYPNATIFWCSPIQAFNASVDLTKRIIAYGNNLSLLTKYGSVQFIDTEKCGITGYTEHNGSAGLYLVDGLHPNANGAKYMGYYNATKVKEYYDSCKLFNN